MAKKDFWITRLDLLKTKMDWNDVSLARRLGISPAMLGHVRAGRRSLSGTAKIWLLDALGYQITRDLVLGLLPRDVCDLLTKADNIRLTVVKSDGPNNNEKLGLPPIEKR